MTDRDTLVEILLEWEERSTLQPNLTVDEFLRDRPEWIAPFRQLLVDLGKLEPLLDRKPNNVQSPPSLNGRYRPYEFVAQGGIGQVFRAQDGEVGRDVAVKVIRPDVMLSLGNQSRFVREAELTGRLEHPGIVPIYGLCKDGEGQPYYAMRFIEGDTFEKIIEEYHDSASRTAYDSGAHNVEMRRLLRHFVAVCETMAYAHEQNVIHRDLKPKNIMIGRFGETIVVDWGLAKNLNDMTVEAAHTAVPDLTGRLDVRGETPSLMQDMTVDQITGAAVTERGQLMGTPAFMSPEQALGEGERVGPASDIYSLGATLYHLLTGRAPFTKESIAAFMGAPIKNLSLRHLIEAVRVGRFSNPHSVNPTVSRSLEAICLKAMRLRTEDRYSSAKELAADVERWLADEPVTAWREPFAKRARRWLRNHRTLVTGTVAALLVGVVASVALAIQRDHAYAKEKVAHDNEINLNGQLNRSIEEINLANVNLNRVNVELVDSNKRESAAKTEAIGEREQAVRALYLARLNYVGNMIEQSNYTYAWNLLRETRLKPGQRSDYRGVEWHLAWNLFQQPALAPVDVSVTASNILISDAGDRIVLIGSRLITVVRVSDGKRLFSDLFNNSSQPLVAASRDLKQLAIIGGQSIEIWSIPDDEPANLHWKFKPFAKSLDAIAMSPDGRLIAATGDGGKITIGEVIGKTLQPTITTFQDETYPSSTTVKSLSFTFDGTVLGFLHRYRPKFWQIDLKREMTFPNLPAGDFSTLQLSGADTLCLWDYNGKFCSCMIEQGGTPLFPKLEFRVRQWEYRDLSSRFAFQSPNDGRLGSFHGITTMQEVSIAGEGPLTLVLSDGVMFGFRTAHYRPKAMFRTPFAPQQELRADDPVSFAIPFPKPVRSFSASADGKYIAIVATDGSVTVGEIARAIGQALEFRHPGPNPVRQLIFMPKGSLLSVGDDLSVVRAIPNGKEEGRLPPLESKNPYLTLKQPRRSVAMSPDGERLAFREENRIDIVYADGGDLLSFVVFGESSLFGSHIPMAFVPGESKLAFATEVVPPRGKVAPDNCYLVIWDYGAFEKDGYALQMLGGSSLMMGAPKIWKALLVGRSKEVIVPTMISTMEVSPSGQWLAAGGRDGGVRMYNLDAFGKVPSWILKASAGVSALRFSKDGNWLAVGSYDGWVRVYSMPDGSLHMELPAHRGDARCLAFSPDGKSLVSGGSEGRIRFINLNYRQDVFTINTGAPVESLAFGPKGDILAVGGKNGELRYYRTITDDAILAAARQRWKEQPQKEQPLEREPRRDYFLALWGAYLARTKADDAPGAAAALREAIESGKLIENPDAELTGWLAEFSKANKPASGEE